VISIHPAALPLKKLLATCEKHRSRRRGPGGQHRNKVETAVTLRHPQTGVQGEASERRSQSENLRVALFRLRINLALSVRCRAMDSPSLLWRSRCRRGRILINPAHDDFPAILAEALDTLKTRGDEVKSAANMLGCTSSQLIKLLKDEPRALAQFNVLRTSRGLSALK